MRWFKYCQACVGVISIPTRFEAFDGTTKFSIFNIRWQLLTICTNLRKIKE